MSGINTSPSNAEPAAVPTATPPVRSKRSRWVVPVLTAALLGGGAFVAYSHTKDEPAQISAAPALPVVNVSAPVVRHVDARLGGLGQFSAIDQIEVRAQVGGTLSEIHFKDGQIVRKGDLLFVIDPRPYEIKLAQAKAQLEAARSRLELADNQLGRARALRQNQFASQDTLDQRVSDQNAAQAALDEAKARVSDAELDLEYTRVTAPFTGRIGARQVSAGGLIAGSRASTSPTTLLATLVSLDPIHLDFEMSENDFLRFQRSRQADKTGAPSNTVDASLADETGYSHRGTLDFIDNVLNRSSGTIRARATFQNPDLFLSPGQFARIRLGLTAPAPALLVPDAAVVADQNQHVVFVLGPDNVVSPRKVEVGDIRNGLRVVRSGIAADDRIVVDGIATLRVGAAVEPKQATIRTASDTSKD